MGGLATDLMDIIVHIQRMRNRSDILQLSNCRLIHLQTILEASVKREITFSILFSGATILNVFPKYFEIKLHPHM